MGRRGLGSPPPFAVIYTVLASVIYFSLGVIAQHALALTPFVFLAAALLFVLTAMTYVEGASLHQDRGGSTVFARYAFNELVSFIAGWAILLDYIILIAVCAFSATQYLRVFWHPLGHHTEALLLALAFIAIVVLGNIRGFGSGRSRRVGLLVAGDLVLQLLIVVIGLILFFDPGKLIDPIHLGSAPKWSDLVFALTVAVISFTSLESAAGLAGEVRIGRRGLKHMVGSGAATVIFGYVGVALVAITALPVHDGHTALAGRYLNDPVIGIVTQIHPHWLADTLRYVVGALATLTLVAAGDSAMPALAGLAAAVLVVPEDLDFLVGIYAFGAMLAFTIAHLSICRLRYSEPDRDRPYKVPLSIRVRGGQLPLPAAFGALVCAAGWVAVMILHEPARYVGLGWMAFGILGYVVYRRAGETSFAARG